MLHNYATAITISNIITGDLMGLIKTTVTTAMMVMMMAVQSLSLYAMSNRS